MTLSRSSDHSRPAPPRGHFEGALKGAMPFHGLIDALTTERKSGLDFVGAVTRAEADACWSWMQHQLAPDLLGRLPEMAPDRLEPLLGQLLERAEKALADSRNAAGNRGVRAFIGETMPTGDSVAGLPAVINALKYRGYVDQARQFGQAVNAISEAALVQALSVLPVTDPGPYSVLIYCAVPEMAQPARLVQAVIRIAGAPTEAAITRAGHVPVIDALFVRALGEVDALKRAVAEAQVEATCRAVDRYHRLARAVTAYIELSRRGRWTDLAGGMTKEISALVEPLLHRVAPDVNRSLRTPKNGEPVDDLQLRSALDSCRILATVRDCRGSLAVNAVCEQTWTQTGEILEGHLHRLTEQARTEPADPTLRLLLDTAIDMAAIRFGTDYADVLRRRRDTLLRRPA